MENNSNIEYVHHINKWWWGKTITLLHKSGIATVEIQFDNAYPSIAFVKGLSVIEPQRRKGYATQMLYMCQYIAGKEGYSFLQLTVNKDEEWLVNWYKRFGFIIIMTDEHEYTMLKSINY